MPITVFDTARDRAGEVLRLVGQLVVEIRMRRERRARRAEQDMIVVGRDERSDRDVAVAARPVLDHDRLAPKLRQLVGHQPRADVGSAAGPSGRIKRTVRCGQACAVAGAVASGNTAMMPEMKASSERVAPRIDLSISARPKGGDSLAKSSANQCDLRAHLRRATPARRIDNRTAAPKDAAEPTNAGSEMEKRPVRRVVTGHDDRARPWSCRRPDALRQPARRRQRRQLLWITNETPADLSSTPDRANQKTGVPPPPNGSICRVVDFAPQASADVKGIDHHEVLRQMGIDPATQGYVRHAFTHRTRSIDYAIVLEGEIDMLLDDTQVHMKAGDIMVQQATNHAWVNTSGKPCRICFVLIDSNSRRPGSRAGNRNS